MTVYLKLSTYLKKSFQVWIPIKSFLIDNCSKPMNYMIRMALIPENLYNDENENLVEFRNLSFLKPFNWFQ